MLGSKHQTPNTPDPAGYVQNSYHTQQAFHFNDK